MYAKRSLCFQRMNDKGSAMADAKAYRDMRQDLPEPCSEEEGAALKLVEVRCVVLCCAVCITLFDVHSFTLVLLFLFSKTHSTDSV